MRYKSSEPNYLRGNTPDKHFKGNLGESRPIRMPPGKRVLSLGRKHTMLRGIQQRDW